MNKKWNLFLICGLLVALNVSQSLIDLFETLIVFTTLINAFKLKHNPIKILPKPLVYSSILLFLAVILSYIFGFDGFNELKISRALEFRWMIIWFCVASLLSSTDWDANDFKYLLFSFSIAQLANFIYYFIQEDIRAGGLVRNAMFFAQTLAPLILVLLNISIYLYLSRSNHRVLKLALLNTFIGSVLLILTQTRGVWVGFALAGLIGLLFLNRKQALMLVSVAVLSASAIIVLSPTIRSRISMNNVDQSYGMDTRFIFWKGNIELFKKHPLFGVGYGLNNRLFFDGLPEEDKKIVSLDKNLQTAHAHNQYIQYLAGTGIFGLLTYLSFISVILFYAGKAIKQSKKESFSYFLAVGLLLGMICFLVAGATECNFSISKNRSLFLFLAAASIAQYTKSKKEVA